LRELTLIPILQHHERLDGSGYPEGLSRRNVHLFGRIAAVADVFDAMTSQRPYAPKVGSFPALRELQEMTPDRLDAEVFRRFVLVLRGGT
jgi:HD-GYP domain-containing protein (c-di-GMP phosphodiesterase class II)